MSVPDGMTTQLSYLEVTTFCLLLTSIISYLAKCSINAPCSNEWNCPLHALIVHKAVRIVCSRSVPPVSVFYHGPAYFPLKSAASCGVSGLHLMHGTLGPCESTSQIESQSVLLFLHSTKLCVTHRHACTVHMNHDTQTVPSADL